MERSLNTVVYNTPVRNKEYIGHATRADDAAVVKKRTKYAGA